MDNSTPSLITPDKPSHNQDEQPVEGVANAESPPKEEQPSVVTPTATIPPSVHVIVADMSQASAASKVTRPSAPSIKNYNSDVSRKVARKGLGRKLLQVLLLVAVLAGVSYYLWYLPGQKAQTYETHISQSFSTQTKNMQAVYKSFRSPAFTGANTKQSEDQADFDSALSAIETAQSSTTALSHDNTLTLRPEQSLFKKAKTAHQHQQKLSEYIKQCQTFLKEYRATAMYIKSIKAISARFSAISDKVAQQAVQASAPDTVINALNSASTDVQGLISNARSLSPAKGMEEFQQKVQAELQVFVDTSNSATAALQSYQIGVAYSQEARLLAAASNVNNFVRELLNNTQKSSQLQKMIDDLSTMQPLK